MDGDSQEVRGRDWQEPKEEDRKTEKSSERR
jgi:hypothetical protein